MKGGEGEDAEAPGGRVAECQVDKEVVEAPSVPALPSSTSQYLTHNFRAPPLPSLS